MRAHVPLERAALPVAFALLAAAFALTGMSESLRVVQYVHDWHFGAYQPHAAPPWVVKLILQLDGLLVAAGIGTLVVLATTRSLDGGMRKAVVVSVGLWVALLGWGFAMRGSGIYGPGMPVQVLLAAAMAVALAWPRARPRWLLVLGGAVLALRGPALWYASQVQFEVLRAGEGWGEVLAWRILPPAVGAVGSMLLAIAYATTTVGRDARAADEAAPGMVATPRIL